MLNIFLGDQSELFDVFRKVALCSITDNTIAYTAEILNLTY